MKSAGRLLVLSAAFLLGCDEPTAPREAATVVVSPDTATLYRGEARQLAFTVHDARGREITGAAVQWSSLDTAVVRVSAGGVVSGVGAGTGRVVAASGAASDTARVTVKPIAGERVVALSVSPDTVDVSAGPGQVTFAVRLREGASAQRVTVVLDAPTLPQAERSCSAAAPEADGAFRCRVNVPQGTHRDQPQVEEVRVEEAAGVRIVPGSELAAAGFGAAFTIRSPNPDPSRPALLGVSFPGSILDASTADVTFSVVFRVRSPGAGIAGYYLQLHSPSGKRTRVCYLLPPGRDGRDVSVGSPALVEGTARDGHWRCSFTLPRYVEGGDWRVSYLSLRDSLDRNTTYGSPEEFARVRVPTTFRVASATPDTVLPQVVGSSVTPDTAAPGAEIRLAVRVRDALSGATYARITTDIVDGYFRDHPIYRACEARLTSGTPNDGVWSCTIPAPTVTAPTTYSLLRVELRDRAENSGGMTKAQLEAAGAGSTFVVRP